MYRPCFQRAGLYLQRLPGRASLTDSTTDAIMDSERTNLGETCRQINFRALRYPPVPDVDRIKSGDIPNDRYPFKRDGTARMSPVRLGLLKNLKERTHNVSFVCVFWNLIRKTDVYSETGHAVLGQEVTCKADIETHFGLFRHPHNDSDQHCTLYRQSITMHISRTMSTKKKSHIYLDHYFQSCEI
jgi:hypothetical protein